MNNNNQKNKLTIRISGASGSGKSALALYLGNHLKGLGFGNILLKDNDWDITERSMTNKMDMERYSEYFRDNVDIEIETVQLCREPIVNSNDNSCIKTMWPTA